MSHNNKNARRTIQKHEMSKARLNGNPGPAQTTPKHGKKNAWWQKFRSYAEAIKGGGKKQKSEQE